MRLRDVEPGDVDAYIRMRCDPVMTAHLGGPQPREGMADKVARDAAEARAGTALIKMIMVPAGPRAKAGPAGTGPAGTETLAGAGGTEVVAGSVALWSHEEAELGDRISEAGWMVLPGFQGRGLAKQAVAAVLHLAGQQGKWGPVHAFPAVSNEPSNRLCRALGFAWVQERDLPFAGQLLRVNHWVIDPGQDGSTRAAQE
jgi:RimJ/RimL family protein N-acetyltransferase